MKYFLPFMILIISLQISSNSLFAGGFQISLNAAGNIAMGHTGIASTENASGIYFNPGSLVFNQKRSILAGVSLVDLRLAFEDEVSGTKYTNEYGNSFPFYFYGDWVLDTMSRWRVGLGVYSPFGNNLNWQDDWPGRFVTSEIDLKTFYFQPTLSYKVTEKLGVGLGAIITYGDVLIRKSIPLATENMPDGEVALEGNALGWGFNAGAFYDLNDFINLGISFISNVDVAPNNGTATFDVPPLLKDSFPDGNISTRLRLPFHTGLGINIKPSEKFSINFDINYTGWSSYDSLIVRFEKTTSVLSDTQEPRLYQNSFAFRFGGYYKPNDNLKIRFGSYFDLTPVQDNFVSPETPDADRIGLSTGLSFKIGKSLVADLGVLYTETMQRTETTELNYAGLGGTYKAKAIIGSLGISFFY